jgi:hypothetical protein
MRAMSHLDVLHNIVPNHNLVQAVDLRFVLCRHIDEDELCVPVEEMAHVGLHVKHHACLCVGAIRAARGKWRDMEWVSMPAPLQVSFPLVPQVSPACATTTDVPCLPFLCMFRAEFGTSLSMHHGKPMRALVSLCEREREGEGGRGDGARERVKQREGEYLAHGS